MKRILLCLLMISLFSYTAIAGTAEQVELIDEEYLKGSVEEYVEGEVLIVINAPSASDYSIMGTFGKIVYESAISNQAEGFAKSFGFEVCNTYPALAKYSGKSIIHLRSANKSTKDLISLLTSAPNVVSVSPNYIFRANRIPNDPNFSINNPNTGMFGPWYLNNIGMPQVWNNVTGSNSVYVAVLDTGIDYNHNDINANMGRDSYGNYGRRFDTTSQVNYPMDSFSHGTHVAGIIGAVGNNGRGIVDVNWTVKMLAVKVLDDNGSSVGASVINGLHYVADQKDSGINIRVANMSLGAWLPDVSNSPYKAAVKDLSDRGIICVMAAGNEGQNISNPTGTYRGKKHYPSSFRFDNTIAVGSIDYIDGKI